MTEPFSHSYVIAWGGSATGPALLLHGYDIDIAYEY
jgi:hypothetical protein